jgi:hypothetical protein
MNDAWQAAAARRRQDEEEEERMTAYNSRDLAEDWEFKILRSVSAAFRSPAKLRRYLDEEAQAGWVLVEKLDDRRIRLKRPASARRKYAGLDFDAYRTTVGLTEGALVWVVLGLSAGVLAALFFFFLLLSPRG